MTYKVLIVEDDNVQREMISLLVKNKLQMTSVTASSGRQALSILAEDEGKTIHLVLADHLMPEMDGLELLQIIKQQYPNVPVIMLTGSTDIKVAVDAMRYGAADFLTKPPEPERLRVSIHNALKLSILEKEVMRLKRQESGTLTFDSLIGHDNGLSSVIKVGRKAASADIPVLLLGETGVGKEVFARAIHGESKRVGKPFVAVNCGAIPQQLVESTLFGHEKGAFTGAINKTIGRFREAEGGTIFLDEVGDLPLEAQVNLLRVLQQKEITPVGGGKPLIVNVRIISATNRDLEKDVQIGKFREDLYFRLNVLSIHLPPLRERAADIPALIRHFVERFSVGEKIAMKEVSKQALNDLCGRPWPGNVRELENVIHRAIVLSEGTTLEKDDFIKNRFEGQKPALMDDQISVYSTETGELKTMEQIEREAMQLALKIADGNVTRAAAMLGIAKSTFYRKM